MFQKSLWKIITQPLNDNYLCKTVVYTGPFKYSSKLSAFIMTFIAYSTTRLACATPDDLHKVGDRIVQRRDIDEIDALGLRRSQSPSCDRCPYLAVYVVHGLGDQLPDLPVGGGDGVEGGGVQEEVEAAQGPQAVRVG